VYNLRTKLHYFLQEHQRMEFPSGISATLQFAEKHWLGRKPRRSWLVSYVYIFNQWHCMIRVKSYGI